jgi:undecaprenyl phosphate N,N'-diacetylbacillosamine 1-phosphate transferase
MKVLFHRFYRNHGKRIFDLLLCLVCLLFLAVPFIIVCLLILIYIGKPVFFIQSRPGKNGRIFKIVKFRTMNNKTDKKGNLLPDSDRMTAFGNFIRRNSLDELPQLVNVINGDLSLVGPRPLIPEYLPLYSKEQARRHDVKPGITGWAQVNGRNAISWKEKFELDIWYVDHISFILDLKILLLTLLTVIKRAGINKEGQATTVAFNGNN